MFYFDGNKWNAYKNKISFTELREVYDDSTDIYQDKADLVITPFELSDTEAKRFEDIRDKASLSVDDIKEYVLYGTVSEELKPLIQKAEEEEQVLALLEGATDERLEKMKSIQKPYEIGRYYERNTLIIDEGVLYRVDQAHTSQEGSKPKDTSALYAKVLTSTTGEPLPWVQPESNNGYKIGDKVIHNGYIWENVLDGMPNVWEPGVVDDRYWKQIGQV